MKVEVGEGEHVMVGVAPGHWYFIFLHENNGHHRFTWASIDVCMRVVHGTWGTWSWYMGYGDMGHEDMGQHVGRGTWT